MFYNIEFSVFFCMKLKCMTIIGLTNFDKGKLTLCTMVQCMNYWKKWNVGLIQLDLCCPF
jgi:hypothetical protein